MLCFQNFSKGIRAQTKVFTLASFLLFEVREMLIMLGPKSGRSFI